MEKQLPAETGNGHSWKEFFIFLLLMAYIVAALGGAYYTAFQYSGPNTLKFAALAMAAGSLGSVVYCTRAFYSYHIAGQFDFDRFIWWYVFRPITGCLLALALFALMQSQIVILTSSDITEDFQSLSTIFAISFLAGFSTEQVVERLRKASKALFGEEK